MQVSVRLYRVVDEEENRTIFVCTDLGHLSGCLKSYFCEDLHPFIDKVVRGLLAGDFSANPEARLGIRISPFFDDFEV